MKFDYIEESINYYLGFHFGSPIPRSYIIIITAKFAIELVESTIVLLICYINISKFLLESF